MRKFNTICSVPRRERQCKSVPQHTRYPQKYHPQSRRTSPLGCKSYKITKDGNCTSCRAVKYQYPNLRCFFSRPEDTRSGFLHNIRNILQLLFYGKTKRYSEDYVNKMKVYNQPTYPLKCIQQHLEELEKEAFYIESVIKEAFDFNCRINFKNSWSLLNTLSVRAEAIRCDLLWAYECYDPCRDHYEFKLLCPLLDQTKYLDGLVNDLRLQLECLEEQMHCYPILREPQFYRKPYSYSRNKSTRKKPWCVESIVCNNSCHKLCLK